MMKVKLAVGLLAAAVAFVVLAETRCVDANGFDHLIVLNSIQHRLMPIPPAQAYVFSDYRTAPLTVAKVFGRAPGCSDASPELITATADAAIDSGLDPAIAAATVATESSCNSFAVSSRGAIGLTQIMPRIWKDHFDFAGHVNLLNSSDNLRAGATIMSGLIHQYGTQAGIQRYNGVGVGCDTCDGGYATRILSLAHK